MATRRSKRGKAGQVDATEEEVEDVKALLPERLFATDRFPSERVNIYSTVDYLLRVKEALKGTPEMEVLAGSSFGGLFKMPARRLLAGKVIHSLLTRQVVTKKKFEMWPVFGGKPLRFSLAEFGEVTGLPCGEFEEGYTIDYQLAPKEENYRYWGELIGEKRDVTIEELMRRVETDAEMPGWMKLRLCLLVIVEGVLVAAVQKPKPALKHVERVENLDVFFAFPWGRESFAWTISTMKPGPKVMGKCEDPNGDLCKKLRQKTVKLVGFPLALQLVAFEAIPKLLEQVVGDRSVTVLDFPGKSLPQHAGLTLADVQKAEHSTELTVKAILDSNVEHEERWGVWDEENVESRKKKRVDGGESRECEPAMKQRRMSEYFKRGAVIDGEKQAKLEKQVEELVQEVVMLKAANVKQGKQMRKLRKAVKKLIDNAGSKSHRRKGKNQREDIAKSVGEPRSSVSAGRKADDDDDAEEAALLVRLREGEGVPAEWVEGEDLDVDELDLEGRDGEEEGNTGEGINGQESVRLDALVGVVLAEMGDDLRSPALEEKEVAVDVANKEEEGTIGRDVDEEEKASEASVIPQGRVDDKPNEEIGGDVDEEEKAAEVSVTAPAGVDEQIGGDVDEEAKAAEISVTAPAGVDEQIGSDVDEEEKTAAVSVIAPARVEDNLNEQIGSDEGSLPGGEEEAVGSGEELTDEEMSVLDVSDSPVTQSERHRPVAQEEELAAVLLARDPYIVSDIVPFYDDCDFPFFEKVLKENAAVVHLNAGGYNLDNQFFLDLATPSKWVSSTVRDKKFFDNAKCFDGNSTEYCMFNGVQHISVLMEHIEQRHVPTLHYNRAMFMSPWFTAHVQGKARAFKAAKCKARVAGDVKITKYLTRDRQRWGADVDTLYAPMIWGGEHWVGLCISLTEWSVLVLDLNPRLKTMEQVAELMEPLATMLPYIAKKVCPAAAVGEAEVVPFLVDRMVGVYVNERSGDCGPVAVKFMQMLATGNQNPTVAGLTDDLVDMFRKQYAVDIYAKLVLPLYLQ
ncbi:hypothetical protein N665_0297s0023 [Sinapis alba]|nr:hypothetical protein N665_0297s0023 [Sinapis alba]